MIRLFTLLIITAALSSCKLYQPRVVDWQDPFTQEQSRTMSVGPSDQTIFLAVIGSPSASLGLYGSNQLIGLKISRQDTIMTFVRFLPERHYDVPASGLVRLKLYHEKEKTESILDLPLLRSYHTSMGSLVVVGKLNQTAIAKLERNRIDIVRIEPVVTNESDPKAVDWEPNVDYARAFQEGVPMLLGWQKGSTKPMRERKPRDDRGLLRRMGKQKSAKN